MRPKDGALWNWPMICMIDRGQGVAMNEAGQVFPITKWIDDEGEDLTFEERGQAVACVAGHDEFGWYSIDLTKFTSEHPQ
jgi:hypothetical protein